MAHISSPIDRIERFNPHLMKDADILHLATGRDAKADILIPTTSRKGGDRDDWLRALDDLLEVLTSVCVQKPPSDYWIGKF